MILKFQIWVNYDTQIFFIKDMFEFVAIKSVVVSVADVFIWRGDIMSRFTFHAHIRRFHFIQIILKNNKFIHVWLLLP